VNFQSSVPGAYFLGPIAAFSFGPLFRFVCGAEYAAPALARHLAGPVRALSLMTRKLTILPSGERAASSPPSSPYLHDSLAAATSVHGVDGAASSRNPVSSVGGWP
jgi:hypothetical protein